MRGVFEGVSGMSDFTKKFKWTTRFIILFMIISLLKDSYVFAQGGIASMPRTNLSPVFDYMNRVSQDYGLVKDTYIAKPKTIVHIQDAHANLEAQVNIQRILNDLSKNMDDYPLIALEGADGSINTNIFSSMGDKKLKESVLERYLEKGLLTGAEYYGIIQNSGAILYGVDDRKLYKDNLSQFKNAHHNKNKIKKYLDQLKMILKDLSFVVFSEEQKGFLEKEEFYRSQEITFFEYLEYLINYARNIQYDFEEFKILEDLYEAKLIEDNINYKLLGNEKEKLINYLSENLVIEDKREFIKINLDYRIGLIDATIFYQGLEKFCNALEIDLNNYPNLKQYMKVVSIWAKADKKIH